MVDKSVLAVVAVLAQLVFVGEAAICSTLDSTAGVRITCGKPDANLLGATRSFKCSQNPTTGTVATFRCQSGFFLASNYSKISCRPNGLWGRPAPICSQDFKKPAMNTPPTKPSTTSTKYTLVQGVGRVKVVLTKMNYFDALKFCVNYDGDLLYFSTETQRAAVSSLIQASTDSQASSFFLGANDISREGNFVNMEGSSVKPLWCPQRSESDTRMNDCILYRDDPTNKTGCMIDVSCDSSESFLCISG